MTLPYTIAQFTNFAQEYSCDAYGAGAYGVCETTASSTESSSGSLVNTGITVAMFVGIAVLILILALVIRFWSKKKQNKKSANTTPQPPVSSQDPPTSRPPQPPKIGG